MSKRTLIAGGVLALATVLAGAALAAPVRAPATGAPAIEADPPADWSIQLKDDTGNSGAVMIPADGSGAVAIAIVSDDHLPSLQTMAATLANGEKSVLLTDSGQATLDGRQGTAFNAVHAASPDHAALDSRYVFVILDPRHVALVLVSVAAAATPAQHQALDDVAAHVRLIAP